MQHRERGVSGDAPICPSLKGHGLSPCPAGGSSSGPHEAAMGTPVPIAEGTWRPTAYMAPKSSQHGLAWAQGSPDQACLGSPTQSESPRNPHDSGPPAHARSRPMPCPTRTPPAAARPSVPGAPVAIAEQPRMNPIPPLSSATHAWRARTPSARACGDACASASGGHPSRHPPATFRRRLVRSQPARRRDRAPSPGAVCDWRQGVATRRALELRELSAALSWARLRTTAPSAGLAPGCNASRGAKGGGAEVRGGGLGDLGG